MTPVSAPVPDSDSATGRRRPARIRLLEAMMSLDEHRSIQEYTVEELAAVAGVAKGSVYYQFGSKEELVREMLVYGAERLQEIMEDGAADPGASVSSARAAFAAQLSKALEFLDEYSSFTGLVAYALARRGADESGQLREEKQSIVALLARGLQRLGHGNNAEITATALLAAAVTLSIERHTAHPEWTTAECARVLMGMV